jgi:hypothetical protein
MNKLSARSANDLMEFVGKLGQRKSQDLPRGQAPTLLMEMGQSVSSAQGEGYLFSLGLLLNAEESLYYFMMQFLIVERGGDPSDDTGLLVYPALYRQDTQLIVETSCHIEGNTIVGEDEDLQILHAKLAAPFLRTLKKKGYLD